METLFAFSNFRQDGFRLVLRNCVIFMSNYVEKKFRFSHMFLFLVLVFYLFLSKHSSFGDILILILPVRILRT